LNALSIENLASGNYDLVVEARDKNNELIDMNKIFFQRSNPGVQIELTDIESVDISSTFAEKITDVDSLRFYLLSLMPISDPMEKQFASNVTQSTDVIKMQKFLYNFWENRNKDYPEAEWNRYKYEVKRLCKETRGVIQNRLAVVSRRSDCGIPIFNGNNYCHRGG